METDNMEELRKELRKLFDKYYEYVYTTNDAEQRGEWKDEFVDNAIKLLQQKLSKQATEEEFDKFVNERIEECGLLCKKYLVKAKEVTQFPVHIGKKKIKRYQRFDTLLYGVTGTPAILNALISYALLYQKPTTMVLPPDSIVYTFAGYYSKFKGRPFSEAYPQLYFCDRHISDKYSEAKVWVTWNRKSRKKITNNHKERKPK